MDKIKERISSADRITSRGNPTVIRLAKLSQAKYRREERLFFAEGVKLSRECTGLPEVRMLVCASENGTVSNDAAELIEALPDDARLLLVTPDVFAKISTEEAPQGVITVLSYLDRLHKAVTAPKGYAEQVRGARLFAVSEVRDPGNLGSIVRTAAAFGYDHVLLGGCADIYNPKTVRASMGALFKVRIDLTDEMPRVLASVRKDGRRVLAAALSDNAVELGTEPLTETDVIAVGNEGHGLPENVIAAADRVLRIPMAPGTESLNAAGAAAVLMWEQTRGLWNKDNK